jgi:hypothetical protein
VNSVLAAFIFYPDGVFGMVVEGFITTFNPFTVKKVLLIEIERTVIFRNLT